MPTLHEQLIERAADQGWIKMTREQPGNWRTAFRKFIRQQPWKDATLSEELDELLQQISARPDAWRIVVEGPETPMVDPWNHPVLVLEFLEVEDTHRINRDKEAGYRAAWGYFDASERFHFRVFHMDRFGTIRPFVTEDTIYNR